MSLNFKISRGLSSGSAAVLPGDENGLSKNF